MPKYHSDIHNAKPCTFDGRDCWIAAIVEGDRIAFELGDDKIGEFGTEKEAKEWADKILKRVNG